MSFVLALLLLFLVQRLAATRWYQVHVIVVRSRRSLPPPPLAPSTRRLGVCLAVLISEKALMFPFITQTVRKHCPGATPKIFTALLKVRVLACLNRPSRNRVSVPGGSPCDLSPADGGGGVGVTRRYWKAA